MLIFFKRWLKILRKRFFTRKPSIQGFTTKYVALDAYCDYMHGKITLEEFKNIKESTEVRPVYEEIVKFE